MTNDPYRHLRIALAEGKCVTDARDRIIKWWETNFMEYVGNGWYFVDSFRFGEHSRIVPDPSMPEEDSSKQEPCPVETIWGCRCGHNYCCEKCQPCGECENCTPKESQPLTYEQALAASHVKIYIGDEEVIDTSKRVGDWTYRDLLDFDLAERRGYRMETIND